MAWVWFLSNNVFHAKSSNNHHKWLPKFDNLEKKNREQAHQRKAKHRIHGKITKRQQISLQTSDSHIQWHLFLFKQTSLQAFRATISYKKLSISVQNYNELPLGKIWNPPRNFTRYYVIGRLGIIL